MTDGGVNGMGVGLSTESLGKRYRSKWALRDVSVELPRGSITALVGPNGAGKSTLLRIWTGFERATVGKVTVLGGDPWWQREAVSTRVGYIAQHPSLYDRLTVRDHLEMAVSYRPEFDGSGALRRLAGLSIDPSSKAGALSGGMQAQVGLVLALGTRAEILLLDEPLASLDPLARREFLSLLVQTSRELNATTVLSSHVVSDIHDVCDRVVVLAHGRVKLDDTVEAIIQGHAILDVGDYGSNKPGLIGSFGTTEGRHSAILRVPLGDPIPLGASQPTMEEVVMGYLAGDRP